MRPLSILALSLGVACLVLAAPPVVRRDPSPAQLASPYRPYQLKLASFYPVNSTSAGLVVFARFNGGKPLRLLLDTGARGIAIHHKAARDAGIDDSNESPNQSR